MPSSRSCSSSGVLRLDEAEHLDLVELVHAEDAARVAAGGARLAAEAGREAGVAQRQLGAVEHLARVQRRERHLARPREVQRVVGEPVDLLLGVGQEARAEQRLLAHEHRRDDRLEAVAAEQLDRPAHERQLEQHEVARRYAKREPATRAPASMSIRPPASSRWSRAESITRGSPTSRSDRVAVGRGRVGRVGQRGERLDAARTRARRARSRAPSASVRAAASRRSPPRRPRRTSSPRRSPPRPRCGARAGAHLGLELAPALVERERAVEALLGPVAPPRERRPDRRGVAADRLEVEHGEARATARVALTRGRRSRCGLRSPEYLATKSATAARSTRSRCPAASGPRRSRRCAIA